MIRTSGVSAVSDSTRGVQGDSQLVSPLAFNSRTTVDTAANVVYWPSEVLGGIILRDCAGADREDRLPSARALAKALPGLSGITGAAVTVNFRNLSTDATLTLTLGSDTTLVGRDAITVEPKGTLKLRIHLNDVLASGSGAEAVVVDLRSPIIANPIWPLGEVTITRLEAGTNATLTAAQVLGGWVVVSPGSAARPTTTLPSASTLIAAIPGATVGTSVSLQFSTIGTVATLGTDAGHFDLLLGSGMTKLDAGTLGAYQNESREFILSITNVGTGTEAVQVLMGPSPGYPLRSTTVYTVSVAGAITCNVRAGRVKFGSGVSVTTQRVNNYFVTPSSPVMITSGTSSGVSFIECTLVDFGEGYFDVRFSATSTTALEFHFVVF